MRGRLHRSAAAILHSDAEADDVLQDAFVKSWQADDRRHDSTHRRAGLVITVRNLCIDRLRRRRIEADTAIPDTADPADTIRSVEAREQLSDVMSYMRDSLSEVNHRVFEMYVIDDMSYEEIALALDISVDTARTCVSRARKKIRERFKKTEL